MIRAEFQENLKKSMQAKDQVATATMRLILAALKDRDIAARGKGNMDGISNDEIISMLQTMVKQRRDSITLYEKGGRQELADREAAEIEIIETFLPEQLNDSEIEQLVTGLIEELNAEGLKDMGRMMAALKEKYAGQMDFSKASLLVKERLSAS